MSAERSAPVGRRESGNVAAWHAPLIGPDATVEAAEQRRRNEVRAVDAVAVEGQQGSSDGVRQQQVFRRRSSWSGVR